MNEKSLIVFLLITAALHGVVYHSYLRLNSHKNVEGRQEVVDQKDLGPLVSGTLEFYLTCLRNCQKCLGLYLDVYIQKCWYIIVV